MQSDKFQYSIMLNKLYIICVIALIAIAIPQKGMSQRNEVGLMFGGSFYMGDLNPKLPMVMVNPGGGLLYRLNFNDYLSARANFLYLRVEGNEQRLATYNPFGDMSFFSDIYEFSMQGEINFLSFLPGNLKSSFSPYVFAGAGGFYFNPKRLLPDGQVISLIDDNRVIAPSSGSGPDFREVESLASYSLLFGMGFKFNVSRYVSAGMEWGMRRTGTDHLDDVSIRGNPKTNDWYSFFGMILTFKFNDLSGARCPYPE